MGRSRRNEITPREIHDRADDGSRGNLGHIHGRSVAIRETEAANRAVRGPGNKRQAAGEPSPTDREIKPWVSDFPHLDPCSHFHITYFHRSGITLGSEQQFNLLHIFWTPLDMFLREGG
jgi:hypothetical protein